MSPRSFIFGTYIGKIVKFQEPLNRLLNTASYYKEIEAGRSDYYILQQIEQFKGVHKQTAHNPHITQPRDLVVDKICSTRVREYKQAK